MRSRAHRLAAVIPLLLLAQVAFGQPAEPPTFTEVSPLTDPLWVTDEETDFWINAVAPADVDSDGDLDLAVLGFFVVYNESAEDRLVIFLNEGMTTDGQWSFSHEEVPLGGLTAGASDLAWGDFDNDRDPDLAVGSNGATVVFRNDAGDLNGLPNVLPPYMEDSGYTGAYDLRSLSWADVDNDGDLDLLIPSVFDSGSFEFRTRLLRNDGADGAGNWQFVDLAAGLDPTTHAQTAWSDEDGDGDLDLFMVNIDNYFGTGFIRRYQNTGGIFAGSDPLGIVVHQGSADWGDYDADGDMDILVAGNIQETDGTFNTVLRVYRNDRNGVYVPETLAVPTLGWLDFHAAHWADYNSDGIVDLLVTGSHIGESEIEGRSEIYLNTGGTFAPIGADLSAPIDSIGRGGTFSWFDVDGDGDLDYLVAGAYFVPDGNGLVEAQIHLYRNDASSANAFPTAPTGLTASDLGAGAVSLSWNSATDDTTTADALTYELEIAPLDAAVSAMAASPLQVRRLPEAGNVSAVASWRLRRMPAGTYSWSVRAVDSAYNAGPRASGTFTVALPPEPLVSVVRPAAGSTLTGSTIIRVSARDDSDRPGQLRVFVLAGPMLLRARYDPVTQLYNALWTTTAVADGTYVVSAIAVDADMNRGFSTVPVKVNNVP